jgi:hypothetical protein
VTFALILAAMRRHPFSFGLTVALAILTASLVGSPTQVALSLWAAVTLAGTELWWALEPIALKRLAGYRKPTHIERQRVESALGPSHLEVLVADTPELSAARCLRCLVVSRDLLDVFEDRALTGLLNQIALSMQSANLAGFALVWIGNAPLLVAWLVARLIGQFGRMLAVVMGTSLVLPLVFCRDIFLRWAGLLFTSVLVGLTGWALISAGHAPAGLGLVLAWLIVPLVRAILAWESRRLEATADRATVAAGYGAQLLEAVDFLALAEPLPVSDKFLRALCLPRSTSVERADRIRRALGEASPVGVQG